jgi:hypothetical protein
VCSIVQVRMSERGANANVRASAFVRLIRDNIRLLTSTVARTMLSRMRMAALGLSLSVTYCSLSV